MAHLLGIDIGTSSTKALVVDETGKVLAQESRPYPVSTPRPGWSEQNPRDWLRAADECFAAVAHLGIDAIGVTGQMHGAVFLDEAGEAVRPAMLWNDQRTQAQCESLDERVGAEAYRRIAGNAPMTGFQLPKAMWLRDNEPDEFARTQRLLLPKDYVVHQWTGAFVTDPADASGTGALDVTSGDWSDAIVEAAAVPRSWLPQVQPAQRAAGGTSSGIPVFCSGGDQSANGIGTGCIEPGVMSLALGSSGVAFSSADAPRFHPSGTLNCFCHASGNWLIMGVSLNCGTAFQWAADRLGFGSVVELEAAASRHLSPAQARFYPYLGGERCPLYDPDASAELAGLTAATSREEIARAVYDGIAFNLYEAYLLVADVAQPAAEIRVSGGGAESAFFVQLLADTFGLPMVRLESDEGPAFGAAITAGVGCGLWADSRAAIEATVREKSRVEPNGTGSLEAYEFWRAQRRLKQTEMGSF